jgi:ADP-ribose pyrophosphatase
MSDGGAGERPDGIAFDGRRFKVRLQTVARAHGGPLQYEIVEAPPAAAIVPAMWHDTEGADGGGGEWMVLLVEQERPAASMRSVEVPAGLVDSGESPEEAAVRELREETGYEAGKLQLLTSVYPTPGISNELIHIYLTTDITRQSEGPEDQVEIARVLTVPLRETVGMVARGAITDAKTAVGLLLARDALAGSGGTSERGQGTGGAGGGGGSVPVDPTNMPFIASEGGKSASGAEPPGALSLESILSQEFNYANVTAYQAMEDRARIFNLYLTLVGVLAAAVGAVSQFGGELKSLLLPVAACLFLLAGILGNVFFANLIRVRKAWRGSALAMNRIKEYYIEHLRPSVPDIDRAFFWRLHSLPKGEGTQTITYLVCYTTAVLGNLCTSVAVLLAGIYAGNQGWIGALASALGIGPVPRWADAGLYAASALLAAAIFLILMRRSTRIYERELSEKPEAKEIAAQENALAAGVVQ